MKFRFNIIALMLLVFVLTSCGGGQTGIDEFSVVSTEPENNATGVEVDTSISVTLTSSLDFENITPEKITLFDLVSGLDIEGEVTVEGNKVIFAPTNPLRSNVDYKLEIANDFSTNINEQFVRDFTLEFKTQIGNDQSIPILESTIPAVNEVGVVLNAGISVTFNEPIKATSVNGFSLFEFDKASGQAGKKINALLSPSSNIVTLTPRIPSNNDELLPNTEYVVIISGITDDAGNQMQDYSWRFTTGGGVDSEPPEVEQEKPLNDTLIPITRNVEATFSEDMDASTLTNSQFTLTNLTTGNLVVGKILYNNRVATFEILEKNRLLEPGSEFEAKIENAKDLAGNTLDTFQWKFSTNASNQAAPEVVNVIWQDLENGSGVAPTTDVVVVFSETIIASSVANDSITLNNGVIGAVSIEDEKTLRFTPSQTLVEQTEYTLTVKSDLTDEDLKPLSTDYVVKFSTGDITPPSVELASEFPSNDDVSVAINATISLRFSESLNLESKDNYLTVMQNGNVVEGSTSVVANEVRFTPNNIFPQNTKISVVANTAVKDLAGNSLVDSFSWSFTSGDTLAPEVQSTTPNANQFFVSTASNVTVNFLADELIDPTTVTADTFFITNVDTDKKIAAEIIVDGGQISLDPNANLLEKTQYKVNVTENVIDASGQKISAPYSWVFTTDDKTLPELSTRIPIIDAKGVVVDQQISVVFSEKIAIDSVNADSIYLAGEQGKIITTISLETANEFVGGVQVEGVESVKLIPTNKLDEQAVYTVYLTSEIKDLYENNLQDASWSFTIGDFTAPTATIDPLTLDELNRVSTTPIFTVRFSESVAVNDAAFKLISTSDNLAVDLSVGWFNENRIAEVSLSLGALVEQAMYQFSLDASALLDGGLNTLTPIAPLNFTVGDFTTPTGIINTPTLDSLNRIEKRPIWTVTFSESMEIDDSAFSLNPVLGDSRVEAIVLNVNWSEENSIAELALAEGVQDLVDEATYSASVNSELLTDVTGNVLDSVDSPFFTIGDFTSPTLINFSPYDVANTERFPRSSDISVSFDEEIDINTVIINNTFTVTENGGGAVAGAISNSSGSSFTFTPSDQNGFNNFSEFTVTLSSGIKDIAGNSLNAAPFSWKFKTNDTIGPKVILDSRTPIPGSQNVGLRNSVNVTFDEAMHVDNTKNAFSLNLVSLSDSSILTPIAVDVPLINAANDSFEFKPTSKLLEERDYVVTIDPTIATDANLQFLTAMPNWTFFTADETKPTVESINIPTMNSFGQLPRRPTITVVFSEAMDSASLNNSDFQLSNDARAGNPSLRITSTSIDSQGRTVVDVLPNSDLASEVNYTFRVKTSIADDSLNKNLLSAEKTKLVNVGDYSSPNVSGELDFPALVNGKMPTQAPDIRVTFDDDMLASTMLAGNFILREKFNPSNTIDLGVTFNSGSTVNLKPLNNLASYTDYEILITTDVMDTSGNHLASEYRSVAINIGDWLAPAVDNISPNITVAGNRAAKQNEIFVTFNESMDITTFDAGDFTLSNGAAIVSITGSSATSVALQTTAPLTGNTDYTLTVLAGSVTDIAGNANALQTGTINVGDWTPPSVSNMSPNITDGSRAGKQNEIIVTFSEVMNTTTYDAGDFTLSNGAAIVSITGSSATSVTLQTAAPLTGNTDYTLTVLAGSVTDIAGNAIALQAGTINIGDWAPPSVSNMSPNITDGSSRAAKQNEIIVTFSEAMNTDSYAATDFTLSGGATVVSITGSDATSVTLQTSMLTGNTDYTLTVLADSVTDVAGNPIAVQTGTINVGDWTPPSVSTMSPNITDGSRAAKQNEFIVTFSEAMNTGSYAATDFTLSGGATVVSITGSDATSVTLQTSMLTGNTDYTLTVLADSVTDVVGNPIAVQTGTINVGDWTPPSVSTMSPNITDGSRAAKQNELIVTFSEAMNTDSYAATDFTLSGGATVVSITGSDATSVILQTSMLTGNTDYTLTVLADSVTDVAGNPIAVQTGTINVGDWTPPSVSNMSPNITDGSRAVKQNELIVTFSEAMNTDSYATTDFTLSGGATVASITSSDATSVTLQTSTLTGNTDYALTVIAGSVTDIAGNAIALQTGTINIGDWTLPTVSNMTPNITETGTRALKQNEIVVTFSENMDTSTYHKRDFELTTLVSGGDTNIDKIISSDTTSVTLQTSRNLVSNVNYTLAVKADSVADTVGNLITLQTGTINIGDWTVPTVSNVTPNITDGSRAAKQNEVIVTFSEAMNTDSYAATDFTLSGGATIASITDSSATSVTLQTGSPLTSNTDYTLTVVAGGVSDSAGNLIAVRTGTINVGDWTAPTVSTMSPNITDGSRAAKQNEIVVTFSEAMNTDSYAATDFTLSGGATVVSITSKDATSVTLQTSTLTGNTDYTLTVLADSVTDVADNPIAVQTGNINVGDWTPPSVSNMSPNITDGSRAAKQNEIVVTFSEAMNTDSYTATDFTLSDGATVVSITSSDATSVTLQTSTLTGNTDYTLTVLADSVTDIAGNPIAIQTGTINVGDWALPTVSTMSPNITDGSRAEKQNEITVTFSEAMNTDSYAATDFTLSGGATVASITSSDATSVTLQTSMLTGNTDYTLTVLADSVTDVVGNPIAVQTGTINVGDWSAPTVSSMTPNITVAGTRAAKQNEIVITFSRSMDATTYAATDFTLSGGATIDSITASDATSVTLQTTSPLTSNTDYTLTVVAASVEDTLGNPIAVQTGTINVGDWAAPSVESTAPAANGITSSNTITINFSEPVDTSGFDGSEFTLTLAGESVETGVGVPSVDNMSISYTITSGIVSNGFYHANFVETLTDSVTNSQAIDIQWDFTSGTLTVARGATNGGQVLTAKEIDSLPEHYYVVTGLTASQRYAINLKGIDSGIDLNLSTYTNAFSSQACQSDYTDSGSNADELCTAMPNSDGELYVKVANTSGSATSFDLTLAIATTTTTGTASVSNKTYDYNTSINGLTSGIEYEIILSGFSEDLDLYVFDGSSSLSPICRSVIASASGSESCIFTAAASQVKVLVDGIKTSSSSVPYLLNATATVLPGPTITVESGASPFTSVTPLVAGSLYYYEFTSLSTISTYTVSLITTTVDGVTDTVDDDFDLSVYLDNFTTLDCSSVNAGTGVESCVSSGGVSSLFVTIDTTNSTADSNFTIRFTANP